jgi:hypothetical protein
MGGNGTVLELVAPVGTIGYKEKILRSFNDKDGDVPLSGLILESAGSLYCAASEGVDGGAGVVARSDSVTPAKGAASRQDSQIFGTCAGSTRI